MPDSYWFASVLIDLDGRWRGRFLRSVPSSIGGDPSLTALLNGYADDDASTGDDLLFVPATASADAADAAVIPWRAAADAGPTACVWLDDGDSPPAAPRYVARSLAAAPYAEQAAPGTTGSTRIVLDTGFRAGWKFGPATADGDTLADIGHLQHCRTPVAAAGRSKPQLLNLLTLVTRDAETRDLEKAFRSDPELAYHLLRLVNSVGMGLTQPVRSLGHAITVIGRRQLQRWLQLLIYANTAAGRDAPNPLLLLAAYRGRLLELLATPGRDPDSAYVIGIFSLLDRILPQKMSEILAKLPIQPAIRDALCNRGGFLGKALAACEAAESGRLEQASIELRGLEIEPPKWLRSQHEAYVWAYAIGRELARPDSV